MTENKEIILEGQQKIDGCKFFGVDPETHDIVVGFLEHKKTYRAEHYVPDGVLYKRCGSLTKNKGDRT